MVDRARFTDMADTADPTVLGSGRFAELTEAEIELMELSQKYDELEHENRSLKVQVMTLTTALQFTDGDIDLLKGLAVDISNLFKEDDDGN